MACAAAAGSDQRVGALHLRFDGNSDQILLLRPVVGTVHGETDADVLGDIVNAGFGVVDLHLTSGVQTQLAVSLEHQTAHAGSVGGEDLGFVDQISKGEGGSVCQRMLGIDGGSHLFITQRNDIHTGQVVVFPVDGKQRKVDMSVSQHIHQIQFPCADQIDGNFRMGLHEAYHGL